MQDLRIITVGLAPAWDITCFAQGLDWGDHAVLERQTVEPGGKALNVSRALAWMGTSSAAAGLWGTDDFAAMRAQLADAAIAVCMTQTPGRTRQNITIIDTQNGREMHLRAASTLANEHTLRDLTDDLAAMTPPGSIVVFAGALPAGNCADGVFALVDRLSQTGARLVLDTSGPLYARLVESFQWTLIKPNLQELGELLGRPVPDTPADIMRAARPLCERTEYVLVSRGCRGAILVTPDRALSCVAADNGRAAVRTVGCGDLLLAGVLSRLSCGTADAALEAGIRAAAARAWGLSAAGDWRQVASSIPVRLEEVQEPDGND